MIRQRLCWACWDKCSLRGCGLAVRVGSGAPADGWPLVTTAAPGEMRSEAWKVGVRGVYKLRCWHQPSAPRPVLRWSYQDLEKSQAPKQGAGFTHT